MRLLTVSAEPDGSSRTALGDKPGPFLKAGQVSGSAGREYAPARGNCGGECNPEEPLVPLLW